MSSRFDLRKAGAAIEKQAAEINRLRADRNAVIRECAKIAAEGCLVPPDGGLPTEAEYQMCQDIKAAILALIEGDE